MSNNGPLDSTAGKVIVVGSLNEDTLIVLDEPFDRGATRLARELSLHAGGKGLNQAIAAARAGADCAIVGCVGGDEAGDRLYECARHAGVDVRGVERLAERPTGQAFVIVEPDGSSTIAVFSGANASVAPRHVPRFKRADVLVTQLEIPLETARTALTQARRAGALSVLSLAPIVPGADELVALADVVVCNIGEAADVLGIDRGDVDALTSGLLGLGAGAVVVTLGDAGAAFADASGTHLVPAVAARSVRDTTGAGDAFVGALAAALLTQDGLAKAVVCGVAARARAVEQLGANEDLSI